MSDDLGFDADEFMRLSLDERATLCRKLAERAAALAASAKQKDREPYERIARAWLQLAADLEDAKSL